MRKILIVGHPSSRYEGVERLLNDCGMGAAKPSRREGMTPSEIGSTLLEAHGVAPSRLLDEQNRMGRVEVEPLWNGLALDLMLGNLDQPLWGWSDPYSVSLLDYWRALDSKITFMLVYDGPETVLTRGNGANGKMSREVLGELLGERVREWCAYNAELLRFYHRNADRCLLVHGQQVRLSAQRTLQQVRARIDVSGKGRGLLRAYQATESSVEPERERLDKPVGQEDALADYLANALMQQFPEALDLYEELQSVASLPLMEPEVNELARRMPGNGDGSNESALAAWQCMMALHQTKRDQEIALQGVQERLREDQERLRAEQARMEEVQAELNRTKAQTQQRIAELEKEREKLEQERREGTEENDLLLLQLHQVQEELERLFVEGEERKATIDSLNTTKKQAEERGKQLEALKQRVEERGRQYEELERKLVEKEKLLQRVEEEKKAAGASSREIEEENDLLLLQLHQVQEELERYYLENQELKKTRLVKVEKASQSLTPYGAADRVKGWLSYRLGACMIERSRSFWGWITMPFALMAVLLAFRRELPQRKALKLPPIRRYADAEKAERVKRHLSYRLGTTLMAHVRNPFRWFLLPWALRREVKEFRRSKRR